VPLVLQVMIFRLITRGTIEERMMQMTKKKMVLEHLVVGRLKAQNINQVNNILLETNGFVSLVAVWNNLNC
jgi:SNF2 family DNA or RNA helicase